MFTELKVLGSLFIGSVVGMPILGQVGQNAPEGTFNNLAFGSAQVVLAVAVLSLSGIFIVVGRKLLNSYEQRVKDANERVESEKSRGDALQEVLSQNSVALANNATASQQLKESVYYLAKVIDKCPGPAEPESVLDRVRGDNPPSA